MRRRRLQWLTTLQLVTVSLFWSLFYYQDAYTIIKIPILQSRYPYYHQYTYTIKIPILQSRCCTMVGVRITMQGVQSYGTGGNIILSLPLGANPIHVLFTSNARSPVVRQGCNILPGIHAARRRLVTPKLSLFGSLYHNQSYQVP